MNEDEKNLDLNGLTNYEAYEIKEAVSTINFLRMFTSTSLERNRSICHMAI